MRARRSGPGLDWEYIAYWVFVGLFVTRSLSVLAHYIGYYAGSPADLFDDATLYYRATEAWLAGGNPWHVTTDLGVPFAGPPPTLLVNLPLQPFGAGVAPFFWPLAGVVGWLYTMRRLSLPPWWILFPPFIEAILAGSPDPALMGLMTIGGGGLTILVKWYAAPSALAEHNWRSLTLAALLLAVSIPLVPWGTFLAELDTVRAAFAEFSINGSAWGQPLLMVATAVALASLGWRLGLLMATPGLWPGAQLHYSLFSARVGVVSPFLGLVLAIPHAAPYGIIAFAVAMRVMHRATPRNPVEGDALAV